MTIESGSTSYDPRYVEARRVLLDALIALAPHASAVIVAGAQAIYLQTGDAGVAIAPYTTDGDLALDPTILGDDPNLEAAMASAGLTRLTSPRGHSEPGTWVANARLGGEDVVIPVDLIVPQALGKPGKRGGGTPRQPWQASRPSCARHRGGARRPSTNDDQGSRPSRYTVARRQGRWCRRNACGQGSQDP